MGHPILGSRFLPSPAWPLLGQVPFSDCDVGLRGVPPSAQGYVTWDRVYQTQLKHLSMHTRPWWVVPKSTSEGGFLKLLPVLDSFSHMLSASDLEARCTVTSECLSVLVRDGVPPGLSSWVPASDTLAIARKEGWHREGSRSIDGCVGPHNSTCRIERGETASSLWPGGDLSIKAVFLKWCWRLPKSSWFLSS